MINQPKLFALSDTTVASDVGASLARLCELAQPGSVGVVLRDRQLAARERLALADKCRGAAQANNQLFLVSDRIDLAREIGADGIHLPADGFLPTSARRANMAVVTRAGHGLLKLASSELDALDAIFLSPVCAFRKGRAALGVDGFARMREVIRIRAPHLKVYALGGVDAEHCSACLGAGADGVAAIGAALHPDKQQRLLTALGIAKRGSS